MRKLTFIILICLVSAVFEKSFAQQTDFDIYSSYSTNVSNAGVPINQIWDDEIEQTIYQDGYYYLFTRTHEGNFPVVNGLPIHNTGDPDYYLAKIDTTGNIIYSTYWGGSGEIEIGSKFAAAARMSVKNGNLYFFHFTADPDMPVTDVSSMDAGSTALALTVFDPNGNVSISRYLSPPDPTAAYGQQMVLVEKNGSFFLSFNRATGNVLIPTTDGSSYTGSGKYGMPLIKVDMAGNMLFSKILAGNSTATIHDLAIDGSHVYMISRMTSGATVVGGEDFHNGLELYIAKLNYSGNLIYSTYLGGNSLDVYMNTPNSKTFTLENGILNVVARTLSSDIATTDGSVYSGSGDNLFFRIDENNEIVVKSYLGGSGSEFCDQAINLNGSTYLVGRTASNDFATTDGSSSNGNGDNFLVKYDASGSKTFCKLLGGTAKENEGRITTDGEFLYLMANTFSPDISVSDDTYLQGGSEFILYRLSMDGIILNNSYIGAATDEGELLYLGSKGDCTVNILYNAETETNPPASNGIPAGHDFFQVSYTINYDSKFTQENVISPTSQSPCLGGYLQTILGNRVNSDNGYLEADYQWEVADSDTGPWTDIDGATKKDLNPSVLLDTKYYRRRAINVYTCPTKLISISNTVEIIGSTLVAPQVDAGGIYYVCENDPVELGSASPATGGLAPYEYSWDNSSMTLNDSTIANPIAIVNESTIFLLTVTDDNGCENIDQAIVFIPKVDAGPDKDMCEGGAAVSIGTPGLPASSNVTYSWEPAEEVACASCPQTTVSPSAATTVFTLSMHVPLQDGSGICTLTDDVTVNIYYQPSDEFAGLDQVVCAESTAILGTTDEGYGYIWNPAIYLTTNDEATVEFGAGSDLPNSSSQNPLTYSLLATSSSCTFYDEMQVAVIEADAGEDGCGARFIGRPDKTPDIDETYTWTVISGTPGFQGATDEPMVMVDAVAPGTTTVYQLEVCYQFGNSIQTCCTDEVVVGECVCDVEINVSGEIGCASTFISDNVELSSEITGVDLDNYEIVWTTTGGVTLSANTGTSVTLTNDAEGTVTATATNIYDGSAPCSRTIPVNNPTWSLPSFSPLSDTVCIGTSVSIGEEAITGYDYAWTGSNGTTYATSNPTFLASESAMYEVTVTDTSNDCMSVFSSELVVPDNRADAGPDLTVCNNATIQIGTADPTGTNQYEWEPQSAPWESGTNEFSAQPEVLIAGAVTFTVTLTDASGCTSVDEMGVIVSDEPSIPDSPDVSVCEGSRVKIGPTEDPSLIYSWTMADGSSAAADLSCTDCAQPDASPIVTTTYLLSATYLGSCNAAAVDNVTVTVNPVPAIELGDAISYCPTDGVNIGDNAPDPSEVVAYLWSPSVGLDDNTIQNPTTTSEIERIYTLEVTDSNGCTNDDNVAAVPLLPPVAGDPKVMCLGETTMLGDVNNAGALLWTGSATADLSCTTCAEPIFEPSAAGTFTFQIEDASSVCPLSSTVIVKVMEVLPPNVAAPAPICSGSCVEIGTTPEAGFAYSWTPSAGLSNPNIANPVACLTSSTPYELTITDLATGCSTVIPLTVGVVSTPAPSITLQDLKVCEGEDVTFSASIEPAGTDYTYLWSPSTGLDNPNIANPKLYTYPTGSTTYTLQVTDTVTGCSSIETMEMVIDQCIIISGNIWNDGDGNIIENQYESPTNADNTLFIYIVNPFTREVLGKYEPGTDGYYQFDINVNSSYSIITSTSDVSVGMLSPDSSLPELWHNTGENMDGFSEVNSLGVINTISGALDVVNQDFGIQRYPDSDDYHFSLTKTVDELYNIAYPLTTASNMNPISGTDPEDGTKGFGDSFMITNLSNMNGNILFYDTNNDGVISPGEMLREGVTIENYNPNLLMVNFEGVGSTSFEFEYAAVDEAGAVDPVPNTYTVDWSDPLPVELLFFQANAVGRTSLLEWITSSELNNAFFEIQRSKDLSSWETLDVMEGHGTSLEEHRYDYTDVHPYQGINYYRLRQVDYNGEFTYSGIRSVIFGTEIEPIVYPNPTLGKFYLRNVLFEDIVGISVYDRIGIKVKELPVNPTLEMDITNLSSGVYYIKVKFSDGQEIMIRMVKMTD